MDQPPREGRGPQDWRPEELPNGESVPPPGRDPGQRFAPVGPEEGLLETCVSMITNPVPTVRRLVRDRPIGWALIVLAVIGALSGVITWATTDFQEAEGLAFLQTIGIVGAFFGAPILSIIGTFIGAGIYWVVCRMLGGQGSYSGLFAGGAFAEVPYVFSIPAALLVLLGPAGVALTYLVQFGLGIWVLVLYTLVLRENNGFTTARAVVALLIPLIAGMVLAFLFAIFLAILLISAIGAG